MIDLLVIGAGLAGLSAALTAAEAGLRVKVVSKGLNSLHWSAATLDLLGYTPPRPAPVREPWDVLSRLSIDHPYGVAGVDRVRAAVERFVGWTQKAGLPYAGGTVPGENFMLPSPVGAMRPVYLAPHGQRGGDLSSEQPLLIAGFDGARDFYPHMLAEHLTQQGRTARGLVLPTKHITQRSDANTVILAAELDKPEHQRSLGAALKAAVRPGERIGMPAILGLNDHAKIIETLSALAGAPVFEIPTLPPSVPGLRLTAALRRLLDSHNVRVEVGMEVIGVHVEGGEVRWVETATGARPLKHGARGFVLATGGVLGGGFQSDHQGRFWELVFDLPLSVPQDRGQWFRPLFLDPAGQPVFRGGVTVNREFQPLDGRGGVVYGNLWAAGGLLSGADPIQERSLEGIAIATGVAAGEAAVAALGTALKAGDGPAVNQALSSETAR
jgi:glycerol-3-phosphate dehydrogenase subunit B